MKPQNEFITLMVLIGLTSAGIIIIIGLFICWCTYLSSMNKKKKEESLEKADCVLYSNQSISTISSKDLNKNKKATINGNGDRKLAHSAQMFHYQLQKQQIIDSEKANNDHNYDSSDNEAQEGDYTVYECPGLAIIGVTEVVNPLFKEDSPADVRPAFHSFSLINETNRMQTIQKTQQ